MPRRLPAHVARAPVCDIPRTPTDSPHAFFSVPQEVEWTNEKGESVERLDPLGAPMIGKRASLGVGGWRAMSMNNRIGHLPRGASESFRADEHAKQIAELAGQARLHGNPSGAASCADGPLLLSLSLCRAHSRARMPLSSKKNRWTSCR